MKTLECSPELAVTAAAAIGIDESSLQAKLNEVANESGLSYYRLGTVCVTVHENTLSIEMP